MHVFPRLVADERPSFTLPVCSCCTEDDVTAASRAVAMTISEESHLSGGSTSGRGESTWHLTGVEWSQAVPVRLSSGQSRSVLDGLDPLVLERERKVHTQTSFMTSRVCGTRELGLVKGAVCSFG